MASVPPAGRRTARRIAGVVIIILGAFFLVSGSVIGFLNVANTDSDGYSLSEPYKMKTTACAYFLAVLPSRDAGSTAIAKWVVTSTTPGNDLFIGWAWFSDVENYTRAFMFETPLHWSWDYDTYESTMQIPDGIIYNNFTPAPSPANQTFWLAHAKTTGPPGTTAKLSWDIKWQPETEKKALVIMNVDGAAGVSANIRFGTKIPILGWLPFPLILLGVVLMAAGAMLVRRKNG